MVELLHLRVGWSYSHALDCSDESMLMVISSSSLGTRVLVSDTLFDRLKDALTRKDASDLKVSPLSAKKLLEDYRIQTRYGSSSVKFGLDQSDLLPNRSMEYVLWRRFEDH